MISLWADSPVIYPGQHSTQHWLYNYWRNHVINGFPKQVLSSVRSKERGSTDLSSYFLTFETTFYAQRVLSEAQCFTLPAGWVVEILLYFPTTALSTNCLATMAHVEALLESLKPLNTKIFGTTIHYSISPVPICCICTVEPFLQVSLLELPNPHSATKINLK